jgi:hypothetical protein
MKNLLTVKRITKATLKSFIKRNADNLFIKEVTRFDSMVDCVTGTKSNFSKVDSAKINIDNYITFANGNESVNHTYGIEGLYLVGCSDDHFELINEDTFVGIRVFNCCGSSKLVIRK